MLSHKSNDEYHIKQGNIEYLAIVSNDESGVIQVMAFDTVSELMEFAETARDNLNYVDTYIARKLT